MPHKRLVLTVKGVPRAEVPEHTTVIIEGELIENTNERVIGKGGVFDIALLNQSFNIRGSQLGEWTLTSG